MAVRWLPVFGWGFVTWLVPFVVSLFCFAPDENGEMGLVMEQVVFKKLMLVVGSFTGHIALHRTIPANIKHSERPMMIAIAHGVIFLAINCVLDIIILLPIANLTVFRWFLEIGVGYLVILFTAILLGANAPSGKSSSLKE